MSQVSGWITHKTSAENPIAWPGTALSGPFTQRRIQRVRSPGGYGMRIPIDQREKRQQALQESAKRRGTHPRNRLIQTQPCAPAAWRQRQNCS